MMMFFRSHAYQFWFGTTASRQKYEPQKYGTNTERSVPTTRPSGPGIRVGGSQEFTRLEEAAVFYKSSMLFTVKIPQQLPQKTQFGGFSKNGQKTSLKSFFRQC